MDYICRAHFLSLNLVGIIHLKVYPSCRHNNIYFFYYDNVPSHASAIFTKCVTFIVSCRLSGEWSGGSKFLQLY